MLNSKNVLLWLNVKSGAKPIKLPVLLPFLMMEELFYSLFDLMAIAGLFIPHFRDHGKNYLEVIYKAYHCLINEPLDLVSVQTPDADIIIKIR